MKKILWSLISESSEGIFISRCVCALHTQSHLTDLLQPHGLYPTRFLCPWDFPGKSTRVGCHFLLQGIFPTQGSNPGLPHCRQTLYCLSHQGSPWSGFKVHPSCSISYLGKAGKTEAGWSRKYQGRGIYFSPSQELEILHPLPSFPFFSAPRNSVSLSLPLLLSLRLLASVLILR